MVKKILHATSAFLRPLLMSFPLGVVAHLTSPDQQIDKMAAFAIIFLLCRKTPDLPGVYTHTQDRWRPAACAWLLKAQRARLCWR